MSERARPWLDPDRADTAEPERRPRPRKRPDEWVLAVLYRLRPAARGPGLAARLATRDVMRRAGRLERLDDAALADLVRAQAPALLRRGIQGRAARIAAAGVREMTRRKLGLVHHPVQITGGLALARGRIVEMATGEGKTITALIPAVLVALTGTPVHLVTVNPYLARRDRETLGPVLEAFGFSVGLVIEDTPPAERPARHDSDIVFTTNSDVAFDYLRDRIAQGRHRSALSALADRALAGGRMDRPRILPRGLGFALVDEVDSILIDEAQTPLIITAEKGEAGWAEAQEALLALAATLEEGRHYRLERRARSVRLLDPAEDILAGVRPPVAALVPLGARREALEQALAALHLYLRDEHYILTGDKIAIVDEFTGRVMPDRQWQRGLHQMIEAKERLDRSGPRETLAQITYQAFFSRYLWFAGMTGTAAEAGRELRLMHGRRVLRLPTHARPRRRVRRAWLYGASDARWRAVVAEARARLAQGRPVLIGTRSVAASEEIERRLRAAGLAPVVLNARQDGDEARIIAEAGQAGRLTVATNMAGRGTDIPVPAEVEAQGGLHVILTEFHGSARIDRQLLGRTGRQGQRGSAVAIVSLEDALFVEMVPAALRLVRALTGGRRGRLPGPLAELLRNLAQARSERQGRRRRRETVRRAERQETTLGFRPDNI